MSWRKIEVYFLLNQQGYVFLKGSNSKLQHYKYFISMRICCFMCVAPSLRGIIMWLMKLLSMNNSVLIIQTSFLLFHTCRRVSILLWVMMSTPLPEKKSSPTCAPDPCRLELSDHCWRAPHFLFCFLELLPTGAASIQNKSVQNRLITRPVVLQLAAFSRTAHTKKSYECYFYHCPHPTFPVRERVKQVTKSTPKKTVSQSETPVKYT